MSEDRIVYPWLPYWRAMFRLPWSGNVTQDINPVADWFSPDITVYAGDASLERTITREVASYGKQLGILTEAVVELADAMKADGPAAARLRALAAEIEAAKTVHRDRLVSAAVRALHALRESDDAVYRRLVANMETHLNSSEMPPENPPRESPKRSPGNGSADPSKKTSVAAS